MEKTTELFRQQIFTQTKVLEKVLIVVFFSCLTAVGAHIYIPLPFTPVPITLQTFFVLLSGAFLREKLGPISQLLYLVLGCFGFPVFATGTAGLARLIGPTGGYLLGFVVSSYVVGKLLSLQKKSAKPLFAFFIGFCIIYVIGALQLKIVLSLSIYETLQKGVIPFIAGDVVKLIVAAQVYKRLQRKNLHHKS